MTTIAADPGIRRDHLALAEAAAVVGSVQIRNRATLAGNICNASPAADTVPALLVDDAVVVVAGPAGERRVPLDEVFVRSGVTTLAVGELVTAIELPRPARRRGTVHVRRTRRRGHDLASVTLACAVVDDGVDPHRLRQPRSAAVAGPRRHRGAGRSRAPGRREARAARASCSPTPARRRRRMRAGPDYRLAMLHVLGLRAVDVAIARLADA